MKKTKITCDHCSKQLNDPQAFRAGYFTVIYERAWFSNDNNLETQCNFCNRDCLRNYINTKHEEKENPE